MGATESVSDAWRIAAADLGIRVTAPFILEDVDGDTVGVVALVHDFGTPAGTLAGTIQDDFETLSGVAQRSKRYVSLLNPETHSRYERQTFIDTLNDWGWYGDGVPPPWYTGEPWTQ
jgi:hypothetical protein